MIADELDDLVILKRRVYKERTAEKFDKVIAVYRDEKEFNGGLPANQISMRLGYKDVRDTEEILESLCKVNLFKKEGKYYIPLKKKPLKGSTG